MKLSRRGFLGFLGAAAGVAVIGSIPLEKLGTIGDTYYMREGETLTGPLNPAWSKIVMKDNCSIRGNEFSGARVFVPNKVGNALISDCTVHGEHYPVGKTWLTYGVSP